MSEIKECEYIYIDDLNNEILDTQLPENKIFITQNSLNEYLMFETKDIQPNGHINNMTKINYKQKVDLIIINNDTPKHNIENIIDQDTIITKKLNPNIIYMEDCRKERCVIITEHEKLIIDGRGTDTKIQVHEKLIT